MTHDEVIDLLTTAAAYDRRKVGEADVIAWHAAISDLDFLDSQNAVIGHYTESTDYLMPAHVRARVKAIRAARIALVPAPAPDPELADNAEMYKEALQRQIKQIASGWAMPKQIVCKVEPNDEYLEARGDDEHRDLRVSAMLVQCPHCQSTAGDRCVNAAGMPLTTQPAHDARLVAAGLARWVEVRGQRQAELIDAGGES